MENYYDFANYAKTFSNQKRLLKEKYHTNLILFYNGGEFAATESKISYVHILLEYRKKSNIIVDDNSSPIWIEDLRDFYNQLLNKRALATDEYFIEYKELSKNRSVKGLVDD